MARTLTTSEAMSAALDLFEAQGIKVTKEMREAAAEAQENEMREAAETIFDRKLYTSTPEATKEWTALSFGLAKSMDSEITGEKVGRGRGEVYERMFRVETVYGSLKVSLTQAVSE